jgi:hypothetical protein
MAEQNTTIKSKGLLESAEDEIENARTAYLIAYDTYVEQPTVVNRNAMYDAYAYLTQIRKQYAEARRLLIAKRVIDQQVQQ